MDMFVYVNMCLYMYLYIDWEKTEAQRKKEQMLLEELVSIVNKRDELVRQRDYEEKGSVMHTSHNICLLTYLLKSSFFLKSQVCRIIFSCLSWNWICQCALCFQVVCLPSVLFWRWSEVQTCIWPSWCHCHSLSLASLKSRLVLPLWYRFTWVVPEKGPLNGCVCALTLLVGQQEGHPACKKLGVQCRLAYGPADATATHCLLLQ